MRSRGFPWCLQFESLLLRLLLFLLLTLENDCRTVLIHHIHSTKTLRVLVNLEHHLIIFVQANLFRLAHDVLRHDIDLAFRRDILERDLFLDFNEAISLPIKLHGSSVDSIFLVYLPLSNAFFLRFPDDLLFRFLRFFLLLALLFRFLYLRLLDQLPVSCNMAEPAFFTKLTLPGFCEVPAAAAML